MTETVEEFKKQHLITYKNAIADLINNNTDALVDGDIMSLVKSPPLDSMDTIKSKLLSLAKKEKIILDNEKMSKIINQFRDSIISGLLDFKEIRKTFLVKKVTEFEPEKETDVIKILKKDLDSINKEMKKVLKTSLNKNIGILLTSVDKLLDDSKVSSNSSISKTFSKYMKVSYVKQLNEGISIKVLVKDRTLLSSISEQGERYLFTKANSHIFDSDKECC